MPRIAQIFAAGYPQVNWINALSRGRRKGLKNVDLIISVLIISLGILLYYGSNSLPTGFSTGVQGPDFF
jgi:hypothetical protein